MKLKILLCCLVLPFILKSETKLTPIDSLQNIDIKHHEQIQFYVTHQSWVLCIDSTGNTNGYYFDGTSISKAQTIKNALDFSKEVKSVVSIGDQVAVIYTDGLVSLFELEEKEWIYKKQISGAKVASEGSPALYICGNEGFISIINKKGELWIHSVKKKIDNAVGFLGFPIATTGTPSSDVLIHNGHIMVLNNLGEIWQHEIVITSSTVFVSFPSKVKSKSLKDTKKILSVDQDTIVAISKNGKMSFFTVK